jgi:hypothetical protein
MAAPASSIKQLARRQTHHHRLPYKGNSAHWINGLMPLLGAAQKDHTRLKPAARQTPSTIDFAT